MFKNPFSNLWTKNDKEWQIIFPLPFMYGNSTVGNKNNGNKNIFFSLKEDNIFPCSKYNIGRLQFARCVNHLDAVENICFLVRDIKEYCLKAMAAGAFRNFETKVVDSQIN